MEESTRSCGHVAEESLEAKLSCEPYELDPADQENPEE